MPTMKSAKRLFVSAGEPSGDIHAANLIHACRALDPSLEMAALGGPAMEAAGARLLHNMLAEFAVMGVAGALRVIPAIHRLRNETLSFLDEWKPDAAVLVDYPGFNVNLAAHLKRRGVPVFYYICPQVWAWAPWRIRKIARRIDKALVVFPFEEDIFRRAGVPVEYVGHPLGDLFASRPLDNAFITNGPLAGSPFVIALLPGSRTHVVRSGFPVKAAAAKIIQSARPDATFAVPVANAAHAEIVKSIAAAQGLDCHVFVGKTHEVMSLSSFALATSGTATLELAHFSVPMVVLYRTNLLGLALKSLLVTTPHIALVNIIAGRRIVPEIVYARNIAPSIASTALGILNDHPRYDEMRREVRNVGALIDAPGASTRAAAAILSPTGK
jgi:lipid-A-disaccharide synthase